MLSVANRRCLLSLPSSLAYLSHPRHDERPQSMLVTSLSPDTASKMCKSPADGIAKSVCGMEQTAYRMGLTENHDPVHPSIAWARADVACLHRS